MTIGGMFKYLDVKASHFNFKFSKNQYGHMELFLNVPIFPVSTMSCP